VTEALKIICLSGVMPCTLVDKYHHF